jgi:hypothetical protein
VNAMRAATAAVLAGLLVACTGDYESFQPPPLDFSGSPPLRLAVERVTVQSAYRPQDYPPFIDSQMPLKPEDAIRQLLENRLVAVGGPGTVQAVILDASVKEEPLETQSGVRGFFTTEPAVRLEGRFQVRVDRLNPVGEVLNSVSTSVVRTRSIPEGAGYAERQKIGYQLMRELLDDLDAALSTNIRTNFGEILRG